MMLCRFEVSGMRWSDSQVEGAGEIGIITKHVGFFGSSTSVAMCPFHIHSKQARAGPDVGCRG